MSQTTEDRPNKYVALKIKGRRIDEHRLIAIKHWGEEAVRGMDVHHINGLKYDNRIENLELVKRGAHARQHNLGKNFPQRPKRKLEISHANTGLITLAKRQRKSFKRPYQETQ